MRKFTFLLSALVVMTMALRAQIVVATFDSLPLQPDTFFVNYAGGFGTDIGFNDAGIHFPAVFDTGAYMGVLDTYQISGFVYSDKRDSVTSGFQNQYSAKTAKGYNTSANYAVAYGQQNGLRVPVPNDSALGFYITNTTFAFNSMRDGDNISKKFGGLSGNDPDFFKLTVHGYLGGQLKPDSVDFYLADYRFADNDSDYLVNTWKWVELVSLGHVDSLDFLLSSSDNGQFGMNTPAYFCMDNFTLPAVSQGIAKTPAAIAKVYPIPAANTLSIDIADNNLQQMLIVNSAGDVLSRYSITGKHMAIDISTFSPGTYLLQFTGASNKAYARFIKL